MSRKTLLAVIAVAGGILTFLQTQFGLSISATGVVAGLIAIVLYIQNEAKLDLKRVEQQFSKVKDPKFWLAFASSMVVVIDNAFTLNLPVEIIVSILAGLMALLFKKESNTLKS